MILRLLTAFYLASLTVMADVPLPARMLDPKSPAEAWNVIGIATANVERLIREKRALEISDQISLLSPALRMLARSPVKPEAGPLLEGQTAQAFRLVNIITQNSMVENIDAMPRVFDNLKQVLTDLAKGFDPAIVQGEVYHCLTHPDALAFKSGEKCPQCQQLLVPRRIPYSFIHARADRPSVNLTFEVDEPPESGQNAKVDFQLHHPDGTPVLDSELWPVHGQKAQVIVTGPNRADFQQFTPTTGAEPGHYFFYFRPELSGIYRIRIALTPFTTGLPEFPSADLEVTNDSEDKAPPPSDSETRRATKDGMQFNLAVMGTKGRQLRAGELQMLRLQVQKATGQPVQYLEPFLNAFAHITGFYADTDTILQLHPVGGDILLPNVHGGPALDFKIYSPKAGMLHLHCQVRVRGKIVTVPFKLRVTP